MAALAEDLTLICKWQASGAIGSLLILCCHNKQLCRTHESGLEFKEIVIIYLDCEEGDPAAELLQMLEDGFPDIHTPELLRSQMPYAYLSQSAASLRKLRCLIVSSCESVTLRDLTALFLQHLPYLQQLQYQDCSGVGMEPAGLLTAKMTATGRVLVLEYVWDRLCEKYNVRRVVMNARRWPRAE